MKKFLITTVLGIATTAAFGAASLRAPQMGGTATVTTPTATNTARAGTMRAQTMKTSSISNPSVTTIQSIAAPVSTETTDARIALLKGIKGFNPGKIKDTTAATNELNAINTRIEELQNKLDVAESAQVNIESKTYTKDEIDTLIAESEQKVPKIDERGNWTDPNGGLIVVPEGAVVIGPNDITIVDGKLSTTSTHPVQNKTVTNALNEKQDKSTTLSFGNADGGWSPVVSGDNYIEIYADSTNMNTGATTTGLRLKPIMIVNNLDNIANENQLVTATAVKNALDALTTNPGGGAPGHDFYLLSMDTRYDSLVTKYWYFAPGITTTAQEGELQILIRDTICGGVFSEKWCFYQTEAFQDGGLMFTVTKRNEGHYLSDYFLDSYNNNGNIEYYTIMTYQINIPDNTGIVTYVNNNLCTNRDLCYTANVVNHTTDPYFLSGLQSIYSVEVVSNFTRLTELPEEYKEETQQTLDD